MLLLLTLLGAVAVALSVKQPNFQNLSLKTVLPLALRGSEWTEQGRSQQPFYREDKIFNGQNADSSISPFQVLVLIGDSYCGGSILNESWVITASHCLVTNFKVGHPRIYEIWAGELNRGKVGDTEQYSRVDMLFPHENYDDDSVSHDIGLLHLETPLTLNDDVKSVSVGDTLPLPGDTVRTSGFGVNHNGESPDKLKWIEQEVPSLTECETLYGGDMIDDTMWCSGDEDMYYRSGAGDSGGPIFQIIDDVPYLVGLVSFSVGQKYDVNNKVTSFNSWIDDVMESEYETLVVTDKDKEWSWSSGGIAYQTRYIKLGCYTDFCRVQIKSLEIQFGGGENFELTMFEGWSMADGDEELDPLVTINEDNYAPIRAIAGYATEEDKMLIVILLGSNKVNVVVDFSYTILDNSLCEEDANKCNEVNDCMDLSDEIGCTYEKTAADDMSEFAAGCYAEDFECAADSYCIRRHKVCDGYQDCPERADEKSIICDDSAALSIRASFLVIFGAFIALIVGQ